MDDDWLPIRAAARRLGVTPTAIRNRIARGTLETRPNGNKGQLVRVPVTVTVTDDRAAGQPVTGTGDPPLPVTVTVRLAELESEIRGLKAMVDELKQARDGWQSAALAALQRPVVIEPQRRPWWRWTRRAG